MDRKEYLKLKKNLPRNLQKLLSSTEMHESLESICKKHEVFHYLSSVHEYVGKAILGLLPPDEFQKTVQEGLGLSKEKAKNITKEINRFIFYPVKSLLEDLYNMEIAPMAQMNRKKPVQTKDIIASTERKKIKKQIEKEKKVQGDTYREPIE